MWIAVFILVSYKKNIMAIFAFGTGVLGTDVYGALLAVSVSESAAMTEAPTTRIRFTQPAEYLTVLEAIGTALNITGADSVAFTGSDLTATVCIFDLGVFGTNVFGPSPVTVRLRASIAESMAAMTETVLTRIRMTYAESTAFSEDLATRLRAVMADDLTLEELETIRLRMTQDETLDLSEDEVCKYFAKLILRSRITRALHLDSHIVEGG